MKSSNRLINCQHCNRLVMVKPSNFEQGFIKCTHQGCGFVNQFIVQSYYDPAIVVGLPEYGSLVLVNNPAIRYPLRFGRNVIGTGETSEIVMEREQFVHHGKCFISRRHCTIELTFDKWKGVLRYQLQDGALDEASNQLKPSLNGTFLENTKLLSDEIIDIPDSGVITLGGKDSFMLNAYHFPEQMLKTYLVQDYFEPDTTQ